VSVASDHSHFIDYGGKGKCKLYDDATPKIAEQVVQAERETVRDLLRTVHGLKASELKF
jgi:hypothetical protein